MYMNGRGPMMGGHRGFGPMMGGPRPMRMRRSTGIGPLGVLFLLPALLFGGWVILAVIGGLIGAGCMILGSVVEGLASVAGDIFSGTFSAGSVAVGFIIGLALFFRFRNRNAARKETTGSVDGEEVEEEIAEPVRYQTYRMGE